MYRWRQISRAVLTLRNGTPNTCRFCAHENAADSKYCSECGEPLRLVPCPRCGAVNDVRKNSCYQCHHQLSECTTDDIALRLSASKDFTPSSGQRSQESDEAAIFAEIKQLYDGGSPNGTDNVNCPALSTDVDRPDDIVPPLSASKDFTPSSGQRSQESDETATRRKIKELYYSNLRRRTARYDRPSPAVEIDRPEDLAPQLPVAEGDSIFRRGFSQTIIGIAILAAIVVVGYYEYHPRFLGDTLRTPEPVAAPASKPAAAPAPEAVAAPASKPAGVPASEAVAAPASKPAGVPASEPAPKATTDTKRAARKVVRSAAVPASPPRMEITSVPTSTFEGELESASAPAIVSFAIAPWGEIYIDGQRRGVNPPMRELELGPGQYEVEVRNTTFPAHVQTIEVEPGTHIKIKHHFR